MKLFAAVCIFAAALAAQTPVINGPMTLRGGNPTGIDQFGDRQIQKANLTFTTETAPVASVLALVTTGGGNVTAGAHLCETTFVTPTGETGHSPASNSVTADGTHTEITVTLPLGTNPVVTGRNVYCTKAGGTFYYLVAASPVVADNTTTSYTFNTADASLLTIYAPLINTTAASTKVNGSPDGFWTWFDVSANNFGYMVQIPGFNNASPVQGMNTNTINAVFFNSSGMYSLITNPNVVNDGVYFWDANSGSNSAIAGQGMFLWNGEKSSNSTGEVSVPLAATDIHSCWTTNYNYAPCLTTLMGDGSFGVIAGITSGSQSPGMPVNVASVNRLGLTALVTATNLVATAIAAQYEVKVAIDCASSSASATVNATIRWHDPSNTAQSATLGTAVVCTTLGSASIGDFSKTFRVKAGTAITYEAAITNTPTYDLGVQLYQLSKQ